MKLRSSELPSKKKIKLEKQSWPSQSSSSPLSDGITIVYMQVSATTNGSSDDVVYLSSPTQQPANR
ncbi:hypothetical protein Hanom_Chr08g00745881 [Helianthus anomalus]